MHDIPGKVIGLFIAFFLIVVAPFVVTVTTTEMINRRAAYTTMCDFVDGVVDSRTITDAELKEFNAKIQTYGMTMDYTISREMRSVDPDPLIGSGAYVRTYIPNDNWKVYNQGDHIALRVRAIGYSSGTGLAHSLVGMFIDDFDETIVARIR